MTELNLRRGSWGFAGTRKEDAMGNLRMSPHANHSAGGPIPVRFAPLPAEEAARLEQGLRHAGRTGQAAQFSGDDGRFVGTAPLSRGGNPPVSGVNGIQKYQVHGR